MLKLMLLMLVRKVLMMTINNEIVYPDSSGFLSQQLENCSQKSVVYDKSFLRVRGRSVVKAEFDEMVDNLEEAKFVARDFRDHCNAVLNNHALNPFRIDVRDVKLARFTEVNDGVLVVYPKFYWFYRNGRKLIPFNELLDYLKEHGFSVEDIWPYMAVEYQRIVMERRILEAKDKVSRVGFELIDVIGLPDLPLMPWWIDVEK